MLNLLFFDDDPHAPGLFYFSYRRLIPNNLLFDGSYITVADSPARFDEASVVRLIIKGLTDGADTFAQRVVIDVFSIPETIQEFRAAYESITMLDQIR